MVSESNPNHPTLYPWPFVSPAAFAGSTGGKKARTFKDQPMIMKPDEIAAEVGRLSTLVARLDYNDENAKQIDHIILSLFRAKSELWKLSAKTKEIHGNE